MSAQRQDTTSPDVARQWIQKRRADGFSMREIASEIGVSQILLSQFVHGDLDSPGIRLSLYEKGLVSAPSKAKPKRWDFRFNRQTLMKRIGIAIGALLTIYRAAKVLLERG
jgi:transcriptional regulator with XRE-family HTH domain